MNKSTFLSVFNNQSLSKRIFNQVSLLSGQGSKSWKWCDVLKLPHILAYYNYLPLLKQCLGAIYYHEFIFSEINKIFVHAMAGGSFEMVEYLIDYFQVNPVLQSNGFFLNDLLCFAASFGRLDMVKQLTEKYDTYKWFYFSPMIAAPKSGNMELLQYVAARVEPDDGDDAERSGNVFNSCARYERIDMIEWLVANRSEDLAESDMYYHAILGCHPNVIQYLLQHHADRLKKYDHSLVEMAALKNQFDTLKILVRLGCALTPLVMDNAASIGNIEMLEWIHHNTTTGCSTSAMDSAARNNHLQTVIWLHENRLEGCSTLAINDAASKGNLEVIKWLSENRSEGCTTTAIDNAAGAGHLETVQWLSANRTEGCTAQALGQAAINSHLETVMWLSANRTEECPLDTATVVAKQPNGFAVLRWIHENRTERCKPKILNNIAKQGFFETFKYLYNLGFYRCSTTKLMDNASTYGNLNILKWLHENTTESCTTSAINFAAREGHLDCVQFLNVNRSEGCTVEAMNNAIDGGYLEVVKYLNDNRSEGCSPNSLERAASHGHLHVLKWLKQNRSERCTPMVYIYAVKNGDVEMVRWIAENIKEIDIQSIDTFSYIGLIFHMDHFGMAKWVFSNVAIPDETLIQYKKDMTKLYPYAKRTIEVLDQFLPETPEIPNSALPSTRKRALLFKNKK
ncbi:hypothetical protein PPL_08804 [Heterostelium album PN500]|uniref:Ankyrin repeat protein n=1 Tax=Heterostelium pallidum (strain ATCC 26659 / Pp 5 / PN500) TaxID=670386 RepID=D3BJS4_HETP5|nr:hypothetical protein PPL_08804 [Heterostelium album PN500]EFA78154.1 hypothetical protein PPL_08804 [Heterostelium album PN500]|eukprot:XP_020430280.1 hypothetical protein PPL_08804 [Heterostelium album PN500]